MLRKKISNYRLVAFFLRNNDDKTFGRFSFLGPVDCCSFSLELSLGLLESTLVTNVAGGGAT